MISYDERIGVPLLEKGKMAGKCSDVRKCCQGFNIWSFIFLIIAEEISTKLDTENLWVKGDCHILNVLLCYMYSECFHFQIIITSVNSWTESLEWRLPSRMQCLSIFLILWLPLYWMQREVEDGTWEFWVNPPFLFYIFFYKYTTLFSQFIVHIFFVLISVYYDY